MGLAPALHGPAKQGMAPGSRRGAARHATSMPTSQAVAKCLPDRLFKTLVHVVEPVKSPYNAAVRRNSGNARASLRVTTDP